MSNWTSYQQKISPGFRNVVKALQDHYTFQDITLNQFNTKSVEDIQNDLQNLSGDSLFYLEYSRSILSVVSNMALEFGSISGIKFNVLERDQDHIDSLTDFLSDSYEEFVALVNETDETLASKIHQAASETIFLEEFANMLINAKELSIWDHFILSLDKTESKDAEHLVNQLRSPSEANINSFRVCQNLSPDSLTSVILSFSENNPFLMGTTASIQNRAKVIFDQNGEGDPNADLWDLYFTSFPEAKKAALEFIRESGSFDTVHQLANVEFSSLLVLVNEDFFMLLTPYYLEKVSQVIDQNSFQYRFIGRLVDDTDEHAPLANWQINAIDANDSEFGDITLRSSISNKNGYFDVFFSSFESISTNYQLDFTLTNPEKTQEYIQSKNYNPTDSETPVNFTVTIATVSDSATISSVESNDIELNIPTVLSNYLTNNNINRLEDVRKIKGLSNQSDLPSGAEISATRIDSHANLELLKGDKAEAQYLAEHSGLINNGFPDIRAITKTNRYDFVKRTKGTFSKSGNTGQYSAGKIYEQANGVMNFVNTKLTEGLTNDFKDYTNDPDIQAALRELTNDPCQCDDCKSGVSPLAYLTDLINYTIKNVEKFGDPILLPSGDLVTIVNSLITLPTGELTDVIAANDLSVTLDTGKIVTIKDSAITLPSGLIFDTSAFNVTLPDGTTDDLTQLSNSYYTGDVIDNNSASTDITLVSGELIKNLSAAIFELPSGTIINMNDSTITLITSDVLDLNNLPVSGDLNLQRLQDLFKHPFADLPIDCSAISDEICQVRVCIEVLWTHLFNGTTVTSSNDLSTSDELKEIRLRTYELLLTEMGTSHEEIRKMRVASDKERQEFANRIGIPVEKIDEFILDHSSSNNEINDVFLEELFGYRDTSRNYKTINNGDTLPNALVKEPKSKLQSCQENHLKEEFHKEDFPDLPYTSLNLPIIDPDIVTPDDFRDPNPSSSPFSIWQKRFDFLSDTAAELKTFKRKASTFPKSKRVVLADYPSSGSLPSSLQVVGPTGDLINLTPIQHNFEANGQTVITVAETPPSILEPDSMITADGDTYTQGGQVMDDLSTDHENGGGIPDQKSIFSRMKEPFMYDGVGYTAWTGLPATNHEEYFELLYGNLRNNQSYTTTLAAIRNSFGLEETEFLKLYELYTKNKLGLEKLDSEQLTDTEWQEIIDIMLLSIKRELQVAWVAEEGNSIKIDTKFFWESIEEPTVGPSPFPVESTYFNSSAAIPLLDPDLINGADLPEITAGKEGIALFANRINQISSAKSNIRLMRISNSSDPDIGFGSLITYVFGTTLSSALESTIADFNSTDPHLHFAAEKKINEEYFLNTEQFADFISVRSKSNNVDPFDQPTEDEWDNLYGNLLTGYKVYNLYPNWLDEEKDGYYDTINTTWKLRKAMFPKWRADVNLRSKWRQELKLASFQPIIDPYLINPIFIKDLGESVNTLSSSNRALQIWDNRRDTLETLRASVLLAVDGNALLNGVESKIETLLGLPISDFLLIKDQQDASINVNARLAQLHLNFQTYERLYNLRSLAHSQGDDAFTDAEKNDFTNILIDAYKKQFFGKWNEEEKSDPELNSMSPFSLSPDYFREEPSKAFEFPPKSEDEKPKYLFDEEEFKKWNRKLQNRIGRLQFITEEIKRSIQRTEKVMLIPTRDALIKHIAAEKSLSYEDTQDYISRNLLIDSEMQCCSSTTRVTQAIEALQILLWGMHHEVILDEEDIQDLVLRASNFEADWKWLGSYASWRAAMFVQLYPENIMLPSLKPDNSILFENTLSNLSKSRSRSDINNAVVDYYSHINDFINLDLRGTIKTRWKGQLVDTNNSIYESDNESLFTFAQSSASGQHFVKEIRIKGEDVVNAKDSDWIQLPEEINGEFIGLSHYEVEGIVLIYLFTSELINGKKELFVSEYDVRKNKWKEKTKIAFTESPDHVEGYLIDLSSSHNRRPFILQYGHDIPNLNADENYDLEPENYQFNFYWMEADLTVGDKLDLKNYNEATDLTPENQLDLSIIKPKYFYYDDYYEKYSLIYKEQHGSSDIYLIDFHKDEVNLGTRISHGHSSLSNNIKTNLLLVVNGSEYEQCYITMKATESGFSYKQYNTGLIISYDYVGGNFQDIAQNFYKIDYAFRDPDWAITTPNTVIDAPIYMVENVNGVFKIAKVRFTSHSNSSAPIRPIMSLDDRNLDSLQLSNEFEFINGKVQFNEEQLKAYYENNSNLAGVSVSSALSKMIQESFLLLPLSVANKLIQLGEFEEAKKYLAVFYDFKENSFIYPNLGGEISSISINDNWAESLLNPFDIAENRDGTLKQSLYLNLINFFLLYANHEFTQDTVESIARAKQLYLEARDLIEAISPAEGNCKIEYDIQIGSNVATYVRDYWLKIRGKLSLVATEEARDTLFSAIDDRWNTADESTPMEKLLDIDAMVESAITANQSPILSLKEELDAMEQKIEEATFVIASNSTTQKVAKKTTKAIGQNFETAILQTTGFKESTIESNSIDMGFLENQGASMLIQEGQESFYDDIYVSDPVNPDKDGSLGEEAKNKPEKVLELTFQRPETNIFSNPSFGFCVAVNPIIRAFELQVELNLYKIRNCLNISGIKRNIEPFAAPTDASTGVSFIGTDGIISTRGLPTPQASQYRYDVLIERSKELINISQQIENSFLSALEKLDDETYSLLKARQDLDVMKAQIKLQDLRIDEALSGIDLASLQTEKAGIQISELQNMINQGLLGWEERLLDLFISLNRSEKAAIIARGATEMSGAISGGVALGALAGPLGAIIGGIVMGIAKVTQVGFEVRSSNIRESISSVSIWSAYERRVQDWTYQIVNSQQDVKIGQQQEVLAQDRLRIVNQEKSIALLQQTQAEVTIDFLLNQQFTTKAIYEYMVEVLEKVYSYFLQESTVTAKLARQQLAFERQQNIPEFIQGDYWVVEDENDSSEEDQPDRKGITGSARLLQDIYRLDQFANQTDQRKQQLSKTISLASLAPFEFQLFKETGILSFSTDMELFDRDHPGHYLRLIKKVSTSVVALIPPVEGIKASLSSLGLSRVVTSGPLFQEQYIRRTPETISLSSPLNDAGTLELNQDDKMLRPFEGSGVETFWEFRMEKAANPSLDYDAVADVLITIEYEALNSFDYRAKVVTELNKESSYQALLPISFKQNLPDQWFDITNPEQAATPYGVCFEINRNNFPVNLSEVNLEQILLFFPQENGERKQIRLSSFSYTDKGGAKLIDKTNEFANKGEYRISASSLPVDGTFELVLDDTESLKAMIHEDLLSDIVMVITFAGETPKYSL